MEVYDPKKIERVAQASGLKEEQARKVAEEITRQIEGKDKVTTIEIRGRMILELEKIDQYAAGFFTWYENNKG